MDKRRDRDVDRADEADRAAPPAEEASDHRVRDERHAVEDRHREDEPLQRRDERRGLSEDQVVPAPEIEADHPELTVVLGETGWATELNPEGSEVQHIKAPAGEASSMFM